MGKEAEMGVVRERGAEKRARKAECQAVLGMGEGDKGGSHRGPCIQQSVEAEERVDGEGESRWEGLPGK